MTETDITRTILKTHAKKFVCVPQCKTGPSMSAERGELHIIDCWCMSKSWQNPLTIAYEIKVSRQDFLNDEKWKAYKPYCNELYFVVTGKEVATADEMPDGVGLKYVSRNGNMMFTKKKAKHYSCDIPPDLFKYVLMHRADISWRDETVYSAKAFFGKWLENKKINQEFGTHVSTSIRSFIDNEMAELRTENRKLQQCNNNYEAVKTFLDKIGITGGDLGWSPGVTVQRRLKELGFATDSDFDRMISRTIDMLQKLQVTVG